MNKGEIIKYVAWQVINPFLLRMRKNKVYSKFNYYGINLGCGIDNPPNWLGIDGGITHYFINKTPPLISKYLFSYYEMSKHYTFD